MEISEITKWTLLLQLAATLAMVGLIWFVQIVHYPLLAKVGRDGFRRYEMDHQRLTTWVVGPLMLTELVTAILLIWYRPAGVNTFSVLLGLGILGSIWLMTYAVQVPQHAAPVLSYDAAVQRRLVLGNWYRTVAWSARGILTLWMVGQVFTITVVPAGQLVRHLSP